MKRFSAALLIALILSVTVFIFAATKDFEPDISSSKGFVDSLNSLAKTGLSKVQALTEIAQNIEFYGGNIMRNSVAITENYLLENIQNTDPEGTEANITELKKILERLNSPTYLMIIPTSCAIKQQELPPQINGLFNQKNFISDLYTDCAALSSTVDVYSNLFAAKEQYTYYRNDSNLTALGGYYVYQVLAGKLGISPRSLNQFEVEHLEAEYYGDLAKKAEYYKLPPDIITLYQFKRYSRHYMLTHHNGDKVKTYYTLFPKHLEALGRPTDAVLGGISPRIDITASSPYQESCLIIGDKTALSYLPFLLVHYGNITFLDFDTLSTTLDTMDYNAFDQVIVGLSIETLLESQNDAK